MFRDILLQMSLFLVFFGVFLLDRSFVFTLLAVSDLLYEQCFVGLCYLYCRHYYFSYTVIDAGRGCSSSESPDFFIGRMPMEARRMTVMVVSS